MEIRIKLRQALSRRRGRVQAAPAISGEPPLKLSTQLFYSVGAAANSMKLRALDTFLLLFYNQVVGMNPATVAAAISITMVFDALFDPLVGHISDNFRHPWGRRHPFMYLAALPLSLSFYFIWNPPEGWSEGALFAYLLVMLLSIRFFDTFFETPSAALLPELTANYHKRTVLFTMRQLLGSLGALVMVILAYQVFMRENPDGTGGVLSREGYAAFSLVFSIAIFVVIIISAAGTHGQIRYLHQTPTRKTSVAQELRDIFGILNNHSVLVIIGSGMLISLGYGIHQGLQIYFALYFWELTQAQLAVIASGYLVAAFIGVPFAPFLARKFGKKRGWLLTGCVAITAAVGPVALRLLGWMPPNGSDLLFYILAFAIGLNAAAGLTSSVLLSSMIADVVEELQVKTGRRSEGLLLAADNFFKKLVSSSGALVTGFILSILSFPIGAERGEVSAQTLQGMGLIHVPTVLILLICALSVMNTFRITEEKHNHHLALLNKSDRSRP